MEPFTNTEFWIKQLEFMIRLIAAGVCGAAIGLERKNRLKEAGIRTHLIVSLASALMMIVSKYGFDDVLINNINNSVKLDPSRVAAGIVSGVGFLGTGMILIRNKSVSGLTTAAGIWATMGVGMAIGSGMYVLGLCAALTIIIAQVLLHRDAHWIKMPMLETIVVHLNDDVESISTLQKMLDSRQIQILALRASRVEKNVIEATLTVKCPQSMGILQLTELFKGNYHLQSLEV